MSGHSKWATIKRKKGALDAKRGKIFTKIIREITVAARIGGGDPESNPRLRSAIQAAKAVNMPNDNITRGIQKGTGELPGVVYDEITYEGYGPFGVAVIVETATDNKNRTVADVRHAFSKNGGNLGENGCVGWMFDKKGVILVSKDGIDEDDLMMTALEAGAEDVVVEEEGYSVTTTPEDFETVNKAIEELEATIESAEVSLVPSNTVKISEEQEESLLKMLDMIDDIDDVQNVHSNYESE
ncbi:MAG: YebC/PmpR family DNA-binding transcriptional regulator [Calditrichaeota bacterium]|nr:MAG: YebC/PmpR family DNA-binding transcriptional regulator [Calditrichota bacterium]